MQETSLFGHLAPKFSAHPEARGLGLPLCFRQVWMVSSITAALSELA